MKRKRCEQAYDSKGLSLCFAVAFVPIYFKFKRSNNIKRNNIAEAIGRREAVLVIEKRQFAFYLNASVNVNNQIGKLCVRRNRKKVCMLYLGSRALRKGYGWLTQPYWKNS